VTPRSRPSSVPFTPGDDGEEEVDEDEWQERFWQARHDLPVPQPAVPAWTEPAPVPPLLLRNRRLQVIVKLANIELTPSRPHYPGSSWHLEGAANEFIVATGIYYFEQTNITPSTLEFRVGTHEPSYGQARTNDPP